MPLATALLQQKIMSISQRKLYGINYRPICFWQNRCLKTACFTVRHRLYDRDLSLEMLADEKALSGLMLAGGIISSKLEAFCVKHLLPPREKERSL